MFSVSHVTCSIINSVLQQAAELVTTRLPEYQAVKSDACVCFSSQILALIRKWERLATNQIENINWRLTMYYLWEWEEVGPKPKVSGLSQAMASEGIQPVMEASSLWLASKVPEMPHRLFLPGGGK